MFHGFYNGIGIYGLFKIELLSSYLMAPKVSRLIRFGIDMMIVSVLRNWKVFAPFPHVRQERHGLHGDKQFISNSVS